MAPALSVLREINNALNPQPGTPRGQIGGGGEGCNGDGWGHATTPGGQKGWTRIN